MWKNADIRGLVWLLPFMLVVLSIILLAKPRAGRHDADNRIATEVQTEPQLFEFDPNTATYDQLRALGLSQVSSAAIVRRQHEEWPFAVKEEVAAIYGVTDSVYHRLEPYIVIADKYRAKPRRRAAVRASSYTSERNKIEYRPFRIDTASVAYLSTIGFSVRQAQVIVNYRERRGGFHSIEEFAECYVVDRQICDTLAHYIIFPEKETANDGSQLIEINTADSAELRSVFGIGEKSVVEILEYRERLGGFCDLNQLSEVKSVTESNFEKILTQIYCDSCKISKIDINFAPQTQLERHPYIAPRKLRKLLSKRQLKGGWSKIEEMVDDDIFTEREAARLRPYLRFTRNPE